MTTDILRSAQRAIKTGDKAQAQQLLRQAIRQQPNDHRSWLWLAGVTDSPEQSLAYIQRADQLRPGDPTIQKAKAWAEKKVKKGSASGDRRSVAPPITNYQPPATSHQPPTTSHQPPTTNHQPPATSHHDAFERLREKSQKSHTEEDTPSDRFGFLAEYSRVIAGIGAILLLILFVGVVGLWISQLATPETITTNEEATELTSRLNDDTSDDTELQPVSPIDVVPTVTPQPIAPKNIVNSNSDPRPTWTATPLPTRTPIPSPTAVPTFVSSSGNTVLSPIGLSGNERWIDVNLTTQSLVAYEGLTPVFETLVSSGLPEFPTVTGQFRVWLRFESQTMDGRRLGYDYYIENVPYVMYFYQDYALHGADWHNNFGQQMSHGCVNLHPDDARWLFEWSSLGTLVNVHY